MIVHRRPYLWDWKTPMTSAVAKEFSAERQLRRRRSQTVDDSGGQIDNTQILQEILALRQLVEQGVGTSPSPAAAAVDDSDIRIEIAQMVRSVARAKSEIAAIKHPMADDDRVKTASSELDAIVTATESATETILNANEQIERLVREIANFHAEDPDVAVRSEAIANHVIEILEACNFQDITGQRIQKVVKTLRFIEERILALISIWGVEAFIDLPVPDAHDGMSEDEALMNGPQISGGITQDEIDRLFD